MISNSGLLFLGHPVSVLFSTR